MKALAAASLPLHCGFVKYVAAFQGLDVIQAGEGIEGSGEPVGASLKSGADIGSAAGASGKDLRMGLPSLPMPRAMMESVYKLSPWRSSPLRRYLRYPLAYPHISEILSDARLVHRCQLHWAMGPGICASGGQALPPDFLLTAKPDAAGAKRFFRKAFQSAGNPIPRVVNVDNNAACPAALEALKAERSLPSRVRLRQSKYLNNIVEQDHRTVKKRIWLAKGYGSFHSARRTLRGIETMHMIHKGRVRWLPKGDAVGQAYFVASLCGIAA
jgi:hypothetical protein